MITERQKSFRQEYRSRIIGFYDGYLHIAIIYAMGAAAFYIYLQHLDAPMWVEMLTIPLTFLFTNLFEWWIHKYIMHRPINVRGLRAIYERHTLNHHQFFTDDEMRFRDHKDWRVTVFPPYALVVFILMSIPGGIVLGKLFTANVGWLFMMTTTGMYLIYEFMHFCCHVEESWFVRNCPFVNTLRRHHTAHHNARLMMETNMNLTFPIADWLFGTSDLDRGLLGHIFNGYDTRHLKSTLRGRPKRPDEAAAAQMGNYDANGCSRGPATASHGCVQAGPGSGEREEAMPNDVKAILSVVTILVGIAIAYWESSIGKGHLFWMVVAFAVFAVVAMWVFPEAKASKQDLARKR